MKALVLSSGGVDSTTALGMAVAKYGKENVIALSISYGQKHDKEIRAAEAVAEYYGVEQLFLDLSKIFRYSNCSLLTAYCIHPGGDVVSPLIGLKPYHCYN